MPKPPLDITLAKHDDKKLVKAAADAIEAIRLVDPQAADEIHAANEWNYTGARTAKRHDKVAGIVAGTMLGWSHRRIAAATGCSVNSIHPVVEVLEARGVLDSSRSRIAKLLAKVTEKTAARLDEELEKPEADAHLVKALWVGLGVGSDKLAGPAPQVHQHLHVHGSEASVQALQDRLSGLAGDSQSTDAPSDSTTYDAELVDDTHHDDEAPASDADAGTSSKRGGGGAGSRTGNHHR